MRKRTYLLNATGWHSLDKTLPVNLPMTNRPPGMVTSLTAALVAGGVQMTWGAASDPDGTVSGYYVYIDGVPIWLAPATATSYLYPQGHALSPGAHSFTVYAVDNLNAFGPSMSVGLTI